MQKVAGYGERLEGLREAMIVEHVGLPLDQAPCLMVWGHGWGQNRKAFGPMAEALAGRAAHLLLDFPGFGESPRPEEVWGTADYAEAVAAAIRPYRKVPHIVWVGHSFGGRVGIQLAARHPDLVDGLCLIAAAGLPRRRSLWQRFDNARRVYTFKTLKHLAPLFGVNLDDLREKFGSPDYRAAGAMRPIFLKTIREDLTEEARRIRCPTCLIYGERDMDTPPEIGHRLATLIPNATLTVLSDQDHYSLQGSGRHVVLKRVGEFLRAVGG